MARTPLLPIVRKYFEDDPLAAAHSLETLSEAEAVSILTELPTTLSAQAFQYLGPTFAASLLKEMSPVFFNEILEKLDPQQASSIFLGLSSDVREKFWDGLSEKIRRNIQEFLAYPKDSAGRIMTMDFIGLYKNMKAREAVQKIRLMARKRAPASYTYVVDEGNHLVGVVTMRDLMLATGDELLESVMRTEVFAVDAFLDREQVANELSKRRYFAVPVVDSEKRLIGIVKAERLIKDTQEEATEDIQKMFGAGGDERAFSPIGFSIRTRLSWLIVNLGTAFLAGSVVALFESTIAKVTVLAVYLPIIAGQGGNAGAQSLAVVMRGLVLREIPSQKIFQLVSKEALIGVINGVAIGVITAMAAWVWHQNPFLGLVACLAMMVNLALAGLFGALIPVSMKAVGLDPAQCSNIILTTVTDCMGFFSLLGFAVIFEKFLV